MVAFKKTISKSVWLIQLVAFVVSLIHIHAAMPRHIHDESCLQVTTKKHAQQAQSFDCLICHLQNERNVVGYVTRLPVCNEGEQRFILQSKNIVVKAGRYRVSPPRSPPYRVNISL